MRSIRKKTEQAEAKQVPKPVDTRSRLQRLKARLVDPVEPEAEVEIPLVPLTPPVARSVPLPVATPKPALPTREPCAVRARRTRGAGRALPRGDDSRRRTHHRAAGRPARRAPGRRAARRAPGRAARRVERARRSSSPWSSSPSSSPWSSSPSSRSRMSAGGAASRRTSHRRPRSVPSSRPTPVITRAGARAGRDRPRAVRRVGARAGGRVRGRRGRARAARPRRVGRRRRAAGAGRDADDGSPGEPRAHRACGAHRGPAGSIRLPVVAQAPAQGAGAVPSRRPCSSSRAGAGGRSPSRTPSIEPVIEPESSSPSPEPVVEPVTSRGVEPVAIEPVIEPSRSSPSPSPSRRRARHRAGAGQQPSPRTPSPPSPPSPPRTSRPGARSCRCPSASPRSRSHVSPAARTGPARATQPATWSRRPRLALGPRARPRSPDR